MARHLQVLSLAVAVVDRVVDNKAEVEHSRDPTSGAKDNALAELLRCGSICLLDKLFLGTLGLWLMYVALCYRTKENPYKCV